MLLFEGIRIAFNALRENKLRTFLTLLGNIVGTMSVIAVVSLIGGIDDYVREKVADEGSNVFTIERVNFLDAITDLDVFLDAIARNKAIRLDDVDYLKNKVPSASFIGSAINGSDKIVSGESSVENIRIRGRSYEYAMIENADLHMGRHISLLEAKRSTPVAVIGWDVYERLFDGLDPIGRKIKIGRKHFRVIGVTKDMGTLFGESRNRFVYIPITAFLKMY